MLEGETATKNVCHSEKTTQTEDDPIEIMFFREPLSPNGGRLKPRGGGVSRTPSFNGSGGKSSLTCGELLALSGALSAALPTHLGIDSRSVHTLYSSLSKGVKHFSAPTLFFSAEQGPAGLPGYFSGSDSGGSESSDWSDEDGWSEEEKPRRPPSLLFRCISCGRSWVKRLVEHKYFQRGILIAILINTLSMGVEYHNQVSHHTFIQTGRKQMIQYFECL